MATHHKSFLQSLKSLVFCQGNKKKQNHLIDGASLSTHLGQLQQDLKRKLSLTEEKEDHAFVDQNRDYLRILSSVMERLDCPDEQVQSEIADFSITRAIRLVYELFQPEIHGKGLELSLDFGPSIPASVSGDLNDFLRLLFFAFDNAVKYTSQGSISITCLYQNEYLLLNFSDTSSGISLDENKELLNLNYSTEVKRISRLSLALAGLVVKSLKGSISVKGEERLGCIVTLNVPFSESQIHGSTVDFNVELMNKLVKKLEKTSKLSRVIHKGVFYLFNETVLLKSALQDDSIEDCLRILHSMKGFPAGFGLPELAGLVQDIEEKLKAGKQEKAVLLHQVDELHRFLSTILVKIPTKKRPEEPSAKKSTSDTKNNLNVLVAEDNKMNQEMLAYILEELNFNFSIVENGRDVLNALKVNSFDLLLLDMQMPIMDGIETVKKIRSTMQWRDLPIIAVTAQNMEGDETKYRQAGCNDFVAKPIDINELTSKIDFLLNR